LPSVGTLVPSITSRLLRRRKTLGKEDQMKSRTIAIAGSLAALAFAAGPVTATAAAQANHRPAVESRIDRSRDATGVRPVDKSSDAGKRGSDYSRDLRDR
jgi:hypothetical protein